MSSPPRYFPPPNSQQQQTGDRHLRRSGDDYAQAFLSLLPQGQAWPRSLRSVLARTCSGLAGFWGFVDGRAADLLERESDPRQTLELLPDWERNWGLPDPCFVQAHTISERRNVLLLKMTLLGGQSRQFFIDAAKLLGYDITIKENAPFMVGVSNVGDTREADGRYRWRIGPAENRFYWSVAVSGMRLTWFRVSTGQVGVDPHVRIARADDLECLLNQWKPAHTKIIFDYSGSPIQ
jgi:uncharacterized protein YmfQ (DUF2313 family)